MKTVFTDPQGIVTSAPPALDHDVWLLALDGSVSRSGICVMSAGGRLGFVCAAVRTSSESPVEYKLKLKRLLSDLIAENNIQRAVYEEPFIGYIGDVKSLYLIASTLEEICVESESPLIVTGVNNRRWKRQFLGVKLQGGRDAQKKQVFDKAVAAYQGLASCKDDETDAFGLASYLARCIREDTLDSMSSRGKPRKFRYDIALYGGRISVDTALQIAGKPRADGIIAADISGKRSFNDTVYELLQNKDAVLLLWFRAGKFGDIILEHNAGKLVSRHEFLSAVVTRKAKKSRVSKQVKGAATV